jgi:fibrillarin-like rRNA methylase
MTNELKSKLESFLKRNPDGFTMKLADGVLYTGNMFYAVGLSHITDIVDTGQDCVDYGVIVLNEDVALSLAKFCNQKAIYDFEKQESVFIGE